ncbi:MAG TPA: alanine--tRNA ligase [Spirochaetota bacterium]|nr:alanine--tRNA ligase [Spirochaetota bacterium]
MLQVKDLRDSFIEFFKTHNHKIVPSSPLIPKDDPTLLFTTAGMVQFKPMFAGTVDLEYTRAASIQKCLRTSDLENVGKTKRHCTFFEMLGNFSFGDYFKKEAIEFAWDYSTQKIKFPEENIWISIYQDDDEAYDLWKTHIGIPPERIVRLGKADNFWGPAGDSGACGPCSELYIDRGPEFGCGSADCRPGCECERFLEYWNLVFNQYFQDIKGNLSPLPKTGIDTGMGLERLATLVQNVDSIYETDELKKFAEFVCRETSTKYEGDAVRSVNTMIEHARALTFAIADGVYPSNEGRGYVLRRIIRRALRYARLIGVTEPFIYRIVDPIIDTMGPYYPEIRDARKNIQNLLEGEEKRFLETLENGIDRLEEIMKGLKKSGVAVMNGSDAFVLYDTFGFPLEMTIEIAAEQTLTVDTAGFENEMNKQRERGKQSWKGGDFGRERVLESLAKKAGGTNFLGYEMEKSESSLMFISDGKDLVSSIEERQEAFLVTKDTTFYGESGGQVGDRGTIMSHNGAVFQVEDTVRFDKTIIHTGRVVRGKFSGGDTITTGIDTVRRNLIKANHTATHLLQAALRKVLGDHVRQSGSIVEPERFRFDFTHFNPLTIDEIDEIERLVNLKAWESIPVTTTIMDLDTALKSGAMAEFGEKYEGTVRVVQVPGFSKELCGGTHLDNTGKIGVFKITREASPGAGLRRIEAITLKGVYERYNTQHALISELASLLNVNEGGMAKKIEDTLKRAGTLEKELEKFRKESLTSDVDTMIGNALLVNGVKIISQPFKGVAIDELRDLSDLIRSKEQESVVLFGSDVDDKALLLFAATNNAVKKGIDCGGIIKAASKILGGGGGGRKDMAQAGGKSPEKLDDALREAASTAKNMLSA